MPLTSTLRTALFRGTSRPSRADSGLLATKRILSGHKVSHSEHKTKRTWKPNVVDQSLYSRVLNEHLRIKVSTSALRTMDKKGGLDAYLLTTPDAKIDSQLGIALKRRVEAVLKEKTSDGAVPLPVVQMPKGRSRDAERLTMASLVQAETMVAEERVSS